MELEEQRLSRPLPTDEQMLDAPGLLTGEELADNEAIAAAEAAEAAVAAYADGGVQPAAVAGPLYRLPFFSLFAPFSPGAGTRATLSSGQP